MKGQIVKVSRCVESFKLRRLKLHLPQLARIGFYRKSPITRFTSETKYAYPQPRGKVYNTGKKQGGPGGTR